NSVSIAPSLSSSSHPNNSPRPKPSNGFAPKPKRPPISIIRTSFPSTTQEPAASRKLVTKLRREALDEPTAIGLFQIAKAIVQTIGLALPEFNSHRTQNKATPVSGQGNVIARIFLVKFIEAMFDHLPVGDDLALIGNPGAEARAAWPRFEIRFGFFARQFADHAGHAHLPF